MYKIKLLQQVFEGTENDRKSGIGWLTKYLELPFAPSAGQSLSCPFHLDSMLPSSDVSVTVQTAHWSCREQQFTVICKLHYLVDLATLEFADTDLDEYLNRQVEFAWDSSVNEANLR